MKYAILILSFFFGLNSLSQLGRLDIEAYQNKSGDISKNISADITNVVVINEETKEKQTFSFTTGDQVRFDISEGIYTVFCQAEGWENPQVLKGIRILPNKITFISPLFEPKIKLNWWQKRKYHGDKKRVTSLSS